MDLANIPLLDVLRERMSWLSARQNVLSQNVAAADTPGYSAQDLKPLDFADLIKRATQPANLQSGLVTTDPNHIAIQSDTAPNFEAAPETDANGNPTGSAVSVEEEMMKVADTQVQYQAATNLYAKAIGMMRTAIDKSGS
jgi:flagellar basal-body rod protein FlgB